MYNDQSTPEQIAAFYTERAMVGAEFLDKEMPGWAARIDLPMLNMSDGRYCVIGQLFRDRSSHDEDDSLYFVGVDELRLGDAGRPTEAALGLFLRNCLGPYSSYPKLTDAWVVEILLRTTENTQESK